MTTVPETVFLEFEFVALIVFSLILPIAIYWRLFTRESISRRSVIGFAVLLIMIAGVNVYLLQLLSDLARLTSSEIDNRVFASGITVALYLIPAVFAGIGVNLLSHVLIGHLQRAERRYDRTDRPRGSE